MPHCNICQRDVEPTDQAEVRSNVRKFSSERFAVWRCPECLSIHARDEADLAYYYANYPFHDFDDVSANWMLQTMYRNMLARLERAGFGKGQSLLDYGCGSGRFLSFLQGKGFEALAGFDEYSERYADRAALSTRYDCLLAQDVIEHVPEPHVFLKTIAGLVKPGGLVVLGTPNAEAIDLSKPEERVHALHQPYHRHILSKRALLQCGQDMGWSLERYYPTMYANTWVPFVNSSFVAHYFRCNDNNLDLANEPISFANWKLYFYGPATLAHALLGAAWAPECDVMAVFRTPAA